VFLQVLLQVVERFQVGVGGLFLRVCDEDDSIGALQNEFATGFVENLPGHSVEMQARFGSADGAKIQRKKIEEQGAIGFRI